MQVRLFGVESLGTFVVSIVFFLINVIAAGISGFVTNQSKKDGEKHEPVVEAEKYDQNEDLEECDENVDVREHEQHHGEQGAKTSVQNGWSNSLKILKMLQQENNC